jgi:hypothetical protein
MVYCVFDVFLFQDVDYLFRDVFGEFDITFIYITHENLLSENALCVFRSPSCSLI